MNNTNDHKYFLSIGLKKISFAVLNSKNKLFFKKEILVESLSIKENIETLENFLNKNIFEIEKKLGDYVKDIYLIICYDNFLKVDLSLKDNFKGTQFNTSNMTNSLIEVKNQFKKSTNDHEIIHMMINKYIIDGNPYSTLINEKNFKHLSVEVGFICLQENIIKDFKKVLLKYQITLTKTLCYDYLKNFKDSNDDTTIFNIASNILRGFNQNEIFLDNKSVKKYGFFEKFFNFFN